GVVALNVTSVSRRRVGGGDLPGREGLAFCCQKIANDKLGPQIREAEGFVIQGGRADDETVELVTVELSQPKTLTAAGRTTIPIISQRSHFIIGRSELLCPFDLLVLRLVNVVIDHPEIELVCALDNSEIADRTDFGRRMAAVGGRSNVTSIGGICC